LTIGPGPALRFRPIPGGPPPLPVLPPVQPASSSGLPQTVLGAFSPDRGAITLLSSSPAATGIPDLGNIPSSLILALAFGPKGGLGSETVVQPLPKADVYERLFLRVPDTTVTENLLRLPVLLQTGHSGTSENSTGASGLAAVMRDIYRRMNTAGLGKVFEMLYDTEIPSRPQNAPSSQKRDSKPPENSKTSERDNDAVDLVPDQSVMGSELQALLAGGLVAALNRRPTRRANGTATASSIASPRN